MSEQGQTAEVVNALAVRMDSGAILEAAPSPRADSWHNVIFGVGGWRDPSSQTHFRETGRLSDQEIEGVMAQDHFGAKVIEALPLHALRAGWDLDSVGDPQEAAILRSAYAREESRLLVREKMREGAFWGRAFGGAVTWIGADDGRDQWEPLDEAAIDSIEFLHTFDRRYAFIWSYYQDPAHPKYGKPETYRILPSPLPSLAMSPQFIGGGSRSYIGGPTFAPQALRAIDVIGSLVHETRIVRWPGQHTLWQRRLLLQGWDDSVLERCWEPLKQLGEDFGGKSLLLGRISQAIYKIKDLYGMAAGKNGPALAARMSTIDLSRSRSRAVLLDADKEDFANIAQPLGGMAELMQLGIQRLASAGNMPVSKLIELAGGLDANDADADRWDDEAETYREESLRGRHEQIARVIMSAKNGPTRGKLPEHWEIKYRPLRRTRPKDAADVRKTNAEAAAIAIDKGIAPPEAYALAWFTAQGKGDPQLDPKEVAAALDRRRELANRPPKDNAELGTVGARAGGGIMDVVENVAAGKIPRESGQAILELIFALTPADAERALGPKGWEPEVTTPTPPGPPPQPAKGTGAGAPQGLPGFNAGGDPSATRLPANEGQ